MIINHNKDIFNLSQITPWNQGNFHQLVKRALRHYFLGLSKLEVKKGSTELADNWMCYEWILFNEGKLVVVMKGGKLVVVNPSNVIEVNGSRTKKGELWQTNSYFEFRSIKVLLEGKDGRMHEEEFGEKEFAVCLNDMEQVPTLQGIELWLDKLAQWLEAIQYDMQMSRKNLIFLVPERPADKDWGEILMSWRQGVFAFVAFESSSRPSVTDEGERRTGFDMSQVQFHIYQPQGKEREQLWQDFRTQWDLMLWTYGICFDVLLNKQERASISEVQAAVDYFTCREQERAQLREQFVRKVGTMLGATYNLKYGRLK